MQSLQELALQVLVKGPAISLRRLSRELRVRINSERFPKKEDPIRLLRAQVSPHYCRIYRGVNISLISPTELTAHSTGGYPGECEVLPLTVRRRYGWSTAGLVYDPKLIRKNQTKLILCDIHQRGDRLDPPEDFSSRIWVETFISQQRLRQLQSLLLPLVRSPASLTSPQIEKDLSKYIERPSGDKTRWKRSYYWKDHNWNRSLFERIIDQKLDLSGLPRSFRRAISRVRFEQVRSRPDEVEDSIFSWNTPRSPERRLNDAHRSTLLVQQRKGTSRFKEGLRYWRWENGPNSTTLSLYEVLMSSPALMLIETSPPPRSLRRLQGLLLPLVRPYVRPKDLPFDLPLDRDDPPEKRIVSTADWRDLHNDRPY